jgi:RNA polymerase sigma-70 factor (ECF subfamily)
MGISMEFKAVYTEYAPRIFRLCMGYVNDHEQARDLTQETFISVWENMASFRQESSISTWIFRIATNNCLRSIEKKKKITAQIPPDIPDLPEDSKEEKLSFLYRCISELEEMDRLIISLVLEDMPQTEIASIVGISHANIRVKVHRIKEKLTLKFKQHGQL